MSYNPASSETHQPTGVENIKMPQEYTVTLTLRAADGQGHRRASDGLLRPVFPRPSASGAPDGAADCISRYRDFSVVPKLQNPVERSNIRS